MNRLPKHEIIRFDQVTQDEYNQVKARVRELRNRLSEISTDEAQALINLGAMAAEGCDFAEITDNLTALRAEAEALEAGVKHLENQREQMKRYNAWLRI